MGGCIVRSGESNTEAVGEISDENPAAPVPCPHLFVVKLRARCALT